MVMTNSAVPYRSMRNTIPTQSSNIACCRSLVRRSARIGSFRNRTNGSIVRNVSTTRPKEVLVVATLLSKVRAARNCL